MWGCSILTELIGGQTAKQPNNWMRICSR